MHWALGAIALLIFVSAITPGPNNLVVLGRASARGAAAAAPAVLGVVAGGIAMIAMAQLGVAAFFVGNAWALKIVELGGCAYLAWLGIALIFKATDVPVAQDRETSLAADAAALFAFQFANPKAWVLVLTAVAAASADNIGTPMLLTVFALISFVSLWTWALLGQVLQRWREKPRVRAWFDRLMGFALLASTVTLAMEYT